MSTEGTTAASDHSFAENLHWLAGQVQLAARLREDTSGWVELAPFGALLIRFRWRDWRGAHFGHEYAVGLHQIAQARSARHLLGMHLGTLLREIDSHSSRPVSVDRQPTPEDRS